MKRFLVFSVCLSAVIAIGCASFLGNQPPTTRSAVGTADSSNWRSQKTTLIRQLQTALETAKKSNDPVKKEELKRLSPETDNLINEIRQANEAKDLPLRATKLIARLDPSSAIVNERDDDLSKTKVELTGQADEALKKAESAVQNTNRTELRPQVENLRDAVGQFKRDVAGSATAGDLASLREGNLKALNDQSEAIVAETTSDKLSWWNVATIGALLAIFVVALALALASFYFRLRISDVEVGLRKYKEQADGLAQQVKNTQDSLAAIKTSINKDNEDLRRQIAATGKGGEEKPKSESPAPAGFETAPLTSPPPPPPPPDPVEPGPSFPALVSDYVSRIGESRKRGLEADFRSELLILSSEQPAPFLYIANDDGPDSGIVLPKGRLRSGLEFSQLYKLYYSCTDPSAGEVYIVSPATVRREHDGSGWKLCDKGQMEIH